MSERVRRTSWSDAILLRLCEPKNHRIWWDGYSYWWQQKAATGKWEVQCTREFDDYNKAYSYLIYNLASWKKEHDYRLMKKRRKELRDIKRRAKLSKKLAKIMSQNWPKKDKIIAVIDLLPDSSQEEIAELLNVSERTVRRYLAKS